MYSAHVTATVEKELAQQRIAVIGALHANSNFTGEDGVKALNAEIENTMHAYDDAIAELYDPTPGRGKEAEDLDWDDPFLRPVKRARDHLEAMRNA